MRLLKCFAVLAGMLAERGWVFKQAYTITSFSKGDYFSAASSWRSIVSPL